MVKRTNVREILYRSSTEVSGSSSILLVVYVENFCVVLSCKGT
jgi:hypothetical protein